MVNGTDKGWVKYMTSQDNKLRDFLIGVDSGTIILDKQFLDSITNKYKVQQEKIRKRIQSIKNGAEFGIYEITYKEYYPCRFISIVDEERGIIEFEEVGIHKVCRESVLNIFINVVDTSD